MVISATIISSLGGYYISMPCQQINYMGGDVSFYPACRADPNGQTAVRKSMGSLGEFDLELYLYSTWRLFETHADPSTH